MVNHRGGIASVNRTIVITKPCPDGETLCSDKQCSEDCDLRQCPFPKPVVFCLHLPEVSLGPENFAAAAAAAAEVVAVDDLYRSLLLGDEEEPNSPPDLVTENIRRRAMLQEHDGEGPAAALPADGVDVQLSVLADIFEEMQASAARASLSVQALAEVAPLVTSAGPDLQKLTGSIMALLDGVSGYFGVAGEGGVSVLRAAESSLEQQQALARDLADLVADSVNSVARMKAMTAKILLQTEFLISMTGVQEAGDGQDAPPCPTAATGNSDFEFVVTSSEGADGGEGFDKQRNGRSLLVSGGKGSSSKKSSTVSQAEEMGDGGYAAAVKAAANALRENSWNLIKQDLSDKSISMLPPRSSAPSDAMAGIKDGVLLHLQRKVRPLLYPASLKGRGAIVQL